MLAAGTDGTDGPTDAAGGPSTRDRAARAEPPGPTRRDPADNDAHALLAAAGDAVITGPTNTNLLDLYLVLRP